MALPAAAVEEEVLQRNSITIAGEDPLVGPFTVLAAPAVSFSIDGTVEDIDESVGVILVDMSHPAVALLLGDLPGGDGLDPNTVPFYEWDFLVRPALDRLLEQARVWLAVDRTERVAFYSAAEEEAPARTHPPGVTAHGGTTSGEPKPKPKRHTVASLASQMETVVGALPSIMDQLGQLAARQTALEQGQRSTEQARPSTPQIVPKASMPVTALLGSPTVPLEVVAKAIGPPPKTKAPPLPGPPTRAYRSLPDDDPAQLDGEPLTPRASPFAEALLEQSKALAALVAHFQVGSADPMTELASSSGTMGVKGAMGREKLQCGLRAVLHESIPEHEPAYVAYCSSASGRVRPGFDLHAVLPREVRGFWPEQASWPHHVVAGPRVRLSLSRAMGGSQRPPGHDLCDDRPGEPRRWRFMAVTLVAEALGRPSIESVDESQYHGYRSPEAFCSSGLPELGYSGSCFPQGDGDSQQQEARGCTASQVQPSSGRGCRPKGEVKAKEEAVATEAAVRPDRRGPRLLVAPSAHTAHGNQAGESSASFSPAAPAERGHVRGPSAPWSTRASHHEHSTTKFEGDEGGLDMTTLEVDKLSFSFVSWCMSLTRRVLAAKTAFSRYLSTTLHACRDGPESSPTALFPLPMPSYAPFAAGVPGESSKKKRERAVDRALHVVVSALNYIYMASSFPPVELIRRQPNPQQKKALLDLRLLLSANDHGQVIEVACSGRKNLRLLSRLQELATAVDALGLSTGPYATGHQGAQVKTDNSKHPQLSPFTNLNADRLKISGRGQWDAASYMPPLFQMSYLEPQLLELDEPVFTRGKPNLGLDKPEEVMKLFKRWDELDLLALHPASQVDAGPDNKVKIFNAYKSSEWDRQIGDRRLQNAREGRVIGPSRDLPCGPLITRLFVPPGCGLRICITDRSDYYHQMGVTLERSRSNLVWPSFLLGSFKGFRAYKDYLARATNKKKPPDRNVHGDGLHGVRPAAFGVEDETPIFGGFKSVLQGDHLGVEYGIVAHAGFLEAHGLLHRNDRLQTSTLIRPRGLYEGLVIDDYFAIAPVPVEQLKSHNYAPSKAFGAFKKAKEAYSGAGLAGSDAKDVIDEVCAAVIGAEVDSPYELASQGLLPVGAPAAKRMSLSWIALSAAKLPYTSDALHSSLLGALVSAFCFRRCGMALLQHLFKIIPPEELDSEKPVLRLLPRKAADELVLGAVLLPIMVLNVKAEVSQTIFSTDASNLKGAVCEASIPKKVAEALWQSGDFKGGHTVLESLPKSLLKSHGGFEEEDWRAELEDFGDPFETSPAPVVERPFALLYDFIEVCGGSGVVSECMEKLGYVVGPIIDLSFSPHYDLTQTRTLEWLLYMIQGGRLRSIMLEPPCTTFSAAAHPMVRSYKQPRGFNQKLTKVWIGNRLAFFCLVLLRAALHASVFGLLETPRRSKMAWLVEWRRLLEHDGVEETFTASCSFGSPFQKEFRFLTANMKPHGICFPCSRDHIHVKIEGSITKGSAVYCPRLAKALADLFDAHLRAGAKASLRTDVKAEGLESPLLNDVVKKYKWHTTSVWRWKGKSHINVLELASYFQAIKKAARKGGGRFCFLLDSYVALRASSKGRSSSRALAPLLRKILAVSLAFAVYTAGLFCPTRLNPSDDPTRDAVLRSPLNAPPIVDFLDLDGIYAFASLPRSRRWASNWSSLSLGLLVRARVLHQGFLDPCFRLLSSRPPLSLHELLMDFDQTLGFPGEGPPGRAFCSFLCFWLILCQPLASHGMLPRHHQDESRALVRATRPLEFGRPVQDVTRSNRQKLLKSFADWLEERGVSFDFLLGISPKEPEQLVSWLVHFGRDLYQSGRPYSHYAETLNAIGSCQPAVRRLLSGAWDLAFSWLREEPYEHHTACPYQIMLAAVSLSIMWGWPRVAGALALSWGAICRIGEVVSATRADLVLPVDTDGSLWTVMLRVGEPKTRFRAARHQLARLDWEDLVGLVVDIYGKLSPHERLWPWSPQALRTRFRQLLEAIGLPTTHGPLGRPLDLGSMRAGGATHLMLITEDSELVRRRGRWISHRTMEIYIQEASSTTFFPRLPVHVKATIHQLALAFPEVCRKMEVLQDCHLPSQTWYHFFAGRSDPRIGKKLGAGGNRRFARQEKTRRSSME